MNAIRIEKLCDYPALLEKAALWFSQKWGVPVREYQVSMQRYIEQKTGIPQWYVVLDKREKIIAGAGVIANDFHDRKDLTPNLCALFVEEAYRRQGIASAVLRFAQQEMQQIGVERLYLVTEHTHFYEKCGWSFLTMVRDDTGEMERMYVCSCGGH